MDYVVIMGYDEHYAGSAEAGSVASIGYVQQGIENTVSAVPQEKVINAVPFYTRLWKWGESLTSEALSMSAAANYLAQYGVAASWDETTCQDYAPLEADGVTNQIWLENAKSLEAKLQVMAAYQLGGIAEWKLGLETPDVWTLIENYVKNEAAIDPEIQHETADVQNTENTGEQTDTADEQAPLEDIVTDYIEGRKSLYRAARHRMLLSYIVCGGQRAKQADFCDHGDLPFVFYVLSGEDSSDLYHAAGKKR